LPATDLTDLLGTALAVSLPTFAWVVLGIVLSRAGLLPARWIDGISRLAFNFGLPLMLCAGAAQVDYTHIADAVHVFAGVAATLLILILSWRYCRWRGYPRAQQGIFVQASFRSNLAIVGVALCVAAYGERGTALAALPVALLTMLYNVLAVWVLDTTLGARTTALSIVFGITRNPLVIGIGIGVVVSLSGMPLPGIVPTAGTALSQFFLPVMLVCIGGSMRLDSLRGAGAIAWEAAAWRLLISPALAVVLGLLLGARGEALGVLFLLLSSPVATASFVMVVAARGDSVLAANLVVLTTLVSVVTVTLGFFLLSLLGVVGQLA
jgi:predicted permease